jgi:hypothetical protein
MRRHSRSTVRKLLWFGPLALLMGLGRTAVSDDIGRVTAEAPAAPECKNAGVTVSFPSGSAEIDQNGRGALAGVATWLQNSQQRTVRLEGFTDRTGNPAVNQRLSERRVQAAKDFLLGRGIEPDRIMAFAHGEREDRPLTGADARIVTVIACEVPKAPATETPAAAPEPELAAAAAEPAAASAPTGEAEPAPAPAPVDEPVIMPVTTTLPPVPVSPRGPPSGLGVEATVGAGAIGFIDEGARRAAGTGATWDARLMFGSRLPIAVEGAYVGSVQNIDALGLSTDSLLVSNGVEGTLRLNLTRARVQPYLFGGVGWAHYQLSNTATNTSSVLGKDDVGTVPLGGGVTARLGRGFIVDARGTYRATFDDDLLRAQVVTNNTMQSWSGAARIGFEF